MKHVIYKAVPDTVPQDLARTFIRTLDPERLWALVARAVVFLDLRSPSALRGLLMRPVIRTLSRLSG